MKDDREAAESNYAPSADMTHGRESSSGGSKNTKGKLKRYVEVP